MDKVTLQIDSLDVEGLVDVTFYMKEVDFGIGDYECHGYSGFDSQKVWIIDRYEFNENDLTDKDHDHIMDYIEENYAELEAECSTIMQDF
jgi:hypothetical protein